METIVDRIRQLCVKNHTSITKIEVELGFANGTIGKWAKGKRKPPLEKVLAIAETLNTTADYLYNGQKESPPPPKGERASDDDIKFALFDGYEHITDEMYEEVKRFARMVRLREEAEREKEK